MDIDELAHAVGVIFCRPPLGDLDLAPGPMDVDADEQIDGAVAAVLAIVAFELARFGRDRLSPLADELERGLLAADPRPAGIGCRTSPMSWTGLSSKQATGRSGSGASA